VIIVEEEEVIETEQLQIEVQVPVDEKITAVLHLLGVNEVVTVVKTIKIVVPYPKKIRD
jgi:hypothetical protein